MNLAIGTLLVATCGTAAALGVFSVPAGRMRRVNRLFLGFIGGLILWAAGTAVMVGAQTAAVAAVGHRVLFTGWCAASTFALAVFLKMAGLLPLLKKWWGALAALLPTAVVWLGYSVLPWAGIHPEHMVATPLGWNDRLANDGWDWANYIQTLLFFLYVLALLLRQSRRAASAHERRQARALLAALAVSGIPGVMTDILPSLLGLPIPPVSAVFMLPVIGIIAFAIRRYRFLCRRENTPAETILNRATRSRVYSYIAGVALCGSALNLVKSLAVRSAGRALSLAFSGVLLVLAVSVVAIDRLHVSEPVRDLLLAMAFSVLIPLGIVMSLQFGNPMTWAFVFILLLASLLFNRVVLLVTVLVSACCSLLFVLACHPRAVVQVSPVANMTRFFLLAAGALMLMYVHRIYVGRLKGNANHARMQAIVSDVSHSFISADETTLSDKFHDMLGWCGDFIECGRGYLLLFDETGRRIRFSSEWLAPGVDSKLDGFRLFLSENPPLIRRQLQEGRVVALRDAWLLPPMAGKIRRLLRRQNIRGILTVPIRRKNQTIGILGFNSAKPLRRWNLDSADFLEVIAGVVSEAVSKVEDERRIQYIAFHDPLTGLPNRQLFSDRLTQSIAFSRRSGKLLAVVFIDLDSFKSVNDTLGHGLGDQLLRQVARMLVHAVRGYDTVSRFGGDEFILLLDRLDRTDDLVPVMEKLMRVLRQPVRLNGQVTFVTASAGAALYPQDGTDAQTLIKNADTAMYTAKGAGKNRFALCSQAMKDSVLERVQLSNLLFRALERGQLELYYQPLVNIERHAVVGCEALIRWNLPGRGIVMPATFIPLAEQTGLIQPIGAWVLETACRQNRHLQEMGYPDMRMTVNLSVHQLKNSRFVGQVDEILRRTGLEPRCLELEITESAAGDGSEQVIRVLTELKRLGISLSIDDFGTEYSSLSRLKQLPIDRIKMDMQFVQGIGRDEKDQAITRVIINLAKSLDLKVTAEGVETKPQLDFLNQRMCDEVQGFYYYHPMPAAELEQTLAHAVPVG